MTNKDDFLIRYLKGCLQLQSFPKIDNGINMVPVDHVARCVVACAIHPHPSPSSSTSSSMEVAQITANPRMAFTEFAETLNLYGYGIEMCGYGEWKKRLVGYVEEQQSEAREEHALMGLYHFVTGMCFFSVPCFLHSFPLPLPPP